MNEPRFYRKAVRLQSSQKNAHSKSISEFPKTQTEKEEISTKTQQVLVINGSAQMATAITRQLLISLPNAAIMYAPTIELAGWILKGRPIDLVISSEVLPDGGSHKLHSVLRQMKNPPDVLMVGRSVGTSVQKLREFGYRMVSRKKVGTPFTNHAEEPTRYPRPKSLIQARVSTLSADLRNDLNNPLQEIVTMAFVARQSEAQQNLSKDALEAIEKAAKQLAGTVSGIEERIKAAVAG